MHFSLCLLYNLLIAFPLCCSTQSCHPCPRPRPLTPAKPPPNAQLPHPPPPPTLQAQASVTENPMACIPTKRTGTSSTCVQEESPTTGAVGLALSSTTTASAASGPDLQPTLFDWHFFRLNNTEIKAIFSCILFLQFDFSSRIWWHDAWFVEQDPFESVGTRTFAQLRSDVDLLKPELGTWNWPNLLSGRETGDVHQVIPRPPLVDS